MLFRPADHLDLRILIPVTFGCKDTLKNSVCRGHLVILAELKEGILCMWKYHSRRVAIRSWTICPSTVGIDFIFWKREYWTVFPASIRYRQRKLIESIRLSHEFLVHSNKMCLCVFCVFSAYLQLHSAFLLYFLSNQFFHIFNSLCTKFEAYTFCSWIYREVGVGCFSSGKACIILIYTAANNASTLYILL